MSQRAAANDPFRKYGRCEADGSVFTHHWDYWGKKQYSERYHWKCVRCGEWGILNRHMHQRAKEQLLLMQRAKQTEL